jgi:hypothetical protein
VDGCKAVSKNLWSCRCQRSVDWQSPSTTRTNPPFGAPRARTVRLVTTVHKEYSAHSRAGGQPSRPKAIQRIGTAGSAAGHVHSSCRAGPTMRSVIPSIPGHTLTAMTAMNDVPFPGTPHLVGHRASRPASRRTKTIGARLPAAAWWFSRNLEPAPPPVDGLGPPTDPVDNWLIEWHHLPAAQRHYVRQAVLKDALSDPALPESVFAGQGPTTNQ